MVSAMVSLPLIIIYSLDRTPLEDGGGWRKTQSSAIKKEEGFFFPKIEKKQENTLLREKVFPSQFELGKKKET